MHDDHIDVVAEGKPLDIDFGLKTEEGVLHYT